MPKITFTVNMVSGEMETNIQGVKGKACQPIHQQISRDLYEQLSIPEVSVVATPEMNESATATGGMTLSMGR